MNNHSESGAVAALVGGSFRHTAGRIAARLHALTRWKFIDDTDDAVQDAFLAALRHWPHRGIPENREAWLFQVAKNALLDRLRRSTHTSQLSLINFDEFSQDVSQSSGVEADSRPHYADPLLRAIVLATHPALPVETRVTLTLRLVCGFSVAELSRLLMIHEESVTRRISRAKEFLRIQVTDEEFQSVGEVSEQRLSGIVDVIYHIFTAGHTAPVGDSLVREDLINEALYIAAEVNVPSQHRYAPLVALRSLIHFHKSRLPSRLSDSGELVTLELQDRARWDKEQIALGFRFLQESQTGGTLTEYHLQAAIASIHASAPTYHATDWKALLVLHDMLVDLNPSPVLALNRVAAQIAAGRLDDAEGELSVLSTVPLMHKYYLYSATWGELCRRQHKHMEAAEHYARAATLAVNAVEKQHLLSRCEECRRSATG